MKRVLCTAASALLLILAVSACAGSTSTPTPVLTTAAPPTASTTTSAPPSTTTKPDAPAPSGQAPKYGGTLNLALTSDISTFDDATQGGPGGIPATLVTQSLWAGDWTKGNAGGYGTKATDWGGLSYDVFGNKTGYIAQSWTVNVNNDQGSASIIYEIRQGIHFALDSNSPGSKLVNGRQLTVADIITSLKEATQDPRGYVYRSNPELRNIDIKQTGPWEITVNCPISSLVTGMSRLGNTVRIYPSEVRDATNSVPTTDWKNQVGVGPFMLTNYVSGSSLTFTKNSNYWMTDPIGPGKGNKLPYVDGVNFIILPDPSTRLAAFRTGKIDEIDTLDWETTAQIQKEFPQMPVALNEGDYFSPGGFMISMRTDKAPYSDIRVRHALTMATDFSSIMQNFNGGNGIIITFPYQPLPGYEGLYAGINDPALPQDVKDQFTYNPNGAKQLLAQAGFPNGFTTSVLCTPTQSDYMQMLAGMWAKAGITLNIDVKDPTVASQILNSQAYTDLTSASGKAPTPIYYSGNGLNGVPGAATNISFVNDPQVQAWLPQIRTLAATDPSKAMALAKQMMIYALQQAWAIQIPAYRTSTFWQSWVKNYSGEISVGYFSTDNWTQFVWIDQTMKTSSGH